MKSNHGYEALPNYDAWKTTPPAENRQFRQWQEDAGAVCELVSGMELVCFDTEILMGGDEEPVAEYGLTIRVRGEDFGDQVAEALERLLGRLLRRPRNVESAVRHLRRAIEAAVGKHDQGVSSQYPFRTGFMQGCIEQALSDLGYDET